MQAYHNDPMIKENLIKQLQAHYDADEIIKGVYWKDGKGCSIGCAIHSDDHKLYEERFNIPEWLAKLQDSIFEGLPNDKAKEWPILFSKSINLGSNLENIKIPFLIFVVESVIDKFNHDEFPDVKKAIDNVLHILKNNPNDKNAVRDADSAWAAWAADFSWTSEAAARAADSAWAAYAADAYADSAEAADSVDSAVRAAAYADSAVRAADSADDAAAYDVYAALAAWAAYEKFADKLIQLIVDCE